MRAFISTALLLALSIAGVVYGTVNVIHVAELMSSAETMISAETSLSSELAFDFVNFLAIAASALPVAYGFIGIATGIKRLRRN